MRPIRALLLLVILLGIWGGWRFTEAQAEYSRMIAGHDLVQASGGVELDRPMRLELAALDQPVGPHAVTTHAVGRNAVRRRSRPEYLAESPNALNPAPKPVKSAALRTPGKDPGFSEAEQAYIALGRGDRKLAAEHFAHALSQSPSHPNASGWAADLRNLRKRWSIDAYNLIRNTGYTIAANNQPVLGGGQSGGYIGYTLNPLAKRPVEVFARLNAAQDGSVLDSASVQAAVGIAGKPLGRRGPTVSAERLIGIGSDARDAWALRIAAGAQRAADHRLPVNVSAYAEAGITGMKRRDIFAGGQVYALYPVKSGDKMRISVGPGAWGSVQDADRTLARLEVGPSAQIERRLGRGIVELRTEYRARVAGNAAPGSGTAVTVATRF